MNLFAVHLLLAFGWAAVNGSFTLGTLAAGLALGYAALWLLRPLYGPTDYFERLGRTLRLAGFFVTELVISSCQVAWDVLTPRHRSRPGFIAFPLRAQTPLEITVVANLISLTPGTLSIDLSEDCSTLWVHAMFVDDADELRRSLRDGMERRVLEVFR